MPDHDAPRRLLLWMVQMIVDCPEDVAIEAIHEDEDRVWVRTCWRYISGSRPLSLAELSRETV